MNRRRIQDSALLVVALLALLATSGCAGQTAREKILGPTLQDVAPRLLSDARWAPSPDAAAVEAFRAAVAAGDWPTSLAAWPAAKEQVEFGIARRQDLPAGTSGGIGANVAASLRKRLAEFDLQLQKMGKAP